MQNQNEKKEWNKRWIRQIAKWQAEIDGHLTQAEALAALIELAKSQIKKGPPE